MANCRRLTTVFWQSFTCVFEFWCSQEFIGCILFKNSGASGKWWKVWHGIVIWVLWQYSVSTLIGIGKFCKAWWILFGESIITMDPKMISCLLDYLSYFGNYSAMLNIHEAAFSHCGKKDKFCLNENILRRWNHEINSFRDVFIKKIDITKFL